MKPKNIYKIAKKPWTTFSSIHNPMHFIVQCILLVLFVLIRVIRRLSHNLGLLCPYRAHGFFWWASLTPGAVPRVTICCPFGAERWWISDCGWWISDCGFRISDCGFRIWGDFAGWWFGFTVVGVIRVKWICVIFRGGHLPEGQKEGSPTQRVGTTWRHPYPLTLPAGQPEMMLDFGLPMSDFGFGIWGDFVGWW